MSVTQQMLTDAREAYHKLMIGHSAVEIRDQNGDMVRYTPANRQQLYMYIQRLEAELTPAVAVGRSRGPLRPIF